MLIEVKVKVTRVIEDKTRKLTVTYLTNKEFFSEAEYQVTELLNEEIRSHLADSFEIQSLKISSIKEVANQYQGQFAFIVTLKDIYLTDDGAEKAIRYKVILWGASLAEANTRAQELSHQGYDMKIESIKQVDYIYLTEEDGTGSQEANN